MYAMRRQLFFWLERLQITTYERRTMMTLIVLLIVVAGIQQIEPGIRYDEEFYRPYEEKFVQLSEKAQQRDSLIAAKHFPEAPPQGGTNGSQDALAEELNAGNEANASAPDSLDSQKDSINVNSAGAERLQELPGVGSTIAERIIAYREENGPFQEIPELLNVRGIGEARLENIRPYITLE